MKDMLHLNIHAAHPSVSLEVFNNYFCYQDKLKNMFNFPATISSISIQFLEALDLITSCEVESLGNIGGLRHGFARTFT